MVPDHDTIEALSPLLTLKSSAAIEYAFVFVAAHCGGLWRMSYYRSNKSRVSNQLGHRPSGRMAVVHIVHTFGGRGSPHYYTA
jgi:hypothetical protein